MDEPLLFHDNTHVAGLLAPPYTLGVRITNHETNDEVIRTFGPARTFDALPGTLEDVVRLMGALLQSYCNNNISLTPDHHLWFRFDISGTLRNRDDDSDEDDSDESESEEEEEEEEEEDENVVNIRNGGGNREDGNDGGEGHDPNARARARARARAGGGRDRDRDRDRDPIDINAVQFRFFRSSPVRMLMLGTLG